MTTKASAQAIEPIVIYNRDVFAKWLIETVKEVNQSYFFDIFHDIKNIMNKQDEVIKKALGDNRNLSIAMEDIITPYIFSVRPTGTYSNFKTDIDDIRSHLSILGYEKLFYIEFRFLRDYFQTPYATVTEITDIKQLKKG